MRILAFVALFTLTTFTIAREPVVGANGMVVCVSPPAADVGIATLKKGGTAVDAAVAVGFAEAVTWPEAGNIGGGGFMMIAVPGSEPICIDYRETAPAAATPDMFADGKTSAFSAKVSGVPGTVRGFALAHKKFGKLPWKDLVMPAVQLAEAGFPVNGPLAQRLNVVLNSPLTTNAEFKRVYGKPGGGDWKAGDTLVLADLGRTLRAIAEKGPDAFYAGETADLLVKEMAADNGLITKADLAKYTAVERKPIHTTYRGFDVYGPPPPSSGGIVLCETLNVLENFDLKKLGRWSPEANHLIIEATRRGFADRASFLGDPAFTKIPTNLTTKPYAKKMAEGIDRSRATPSAQLGPKLSPRDDGDSTTHYSIIDKEGLAVSNTYTLENSFGNRVVVRGAGFILNNEMTDFNMKPGVTTTAGGIGTAPNQVAPGKRMLSSMTPTIVMKGGKPVLITGSPGGRTIINTVLSVVLNTLEFDMPVCEAVDSPRLHHQWFPDVVQMERLAEKPELAAKLKAMGHILKANKQGDAHSIGIDPKTGQYRGAADLRIDGKAAGY